MKNFTLESTKIENPENVISAFKNAGFAETTYEGQDGVFLSKDFHVNDINCIDDILGNDLSSDMVRVELIQDGVLQICVHDSMTHEKLEPDESCWKTLAKAAGVATE